MAMVVLVIMYWEGMAHIIAVLILPDVQEREHPHTYILVIVMCSAGMVHVVPVLVLLTLKQPITNS